MDGGHRGIDFVSQCLGGEEENGRVLEGEAPGEMRALVLLTGGVLRCTDGCR